MDLETESDKTHTRCIKTDAAGLEKRISESRGYKDTLKLGVQTLEQTCQKGCQTITQIYETWTLEFKTNDASKHTPTHG